VSPTSFPIGTNPVRHSDHRAFDWLLTNQMRLPRAFPTCSSVLAVFGTLPPELLADCTHLSPMQPTPDRAPHPETAGRPWHISLEPADYPSPSTLRKVPSHGSDLRKITFNRLLPSPSLNTNPVRNRCSTTRRTFTSLSPAPGAITLTLIFVLSQCFPTLRLVILCSEPHLAIMRWLGLHRRTA
jgi:hypothetical protein